MSKKFFLFLFLNFFVIFLSYLFFTFPETNIFSFLNNVSIKPTDTTTKLTIQNLDNNQVKPLLNQGGSLFQKTIGGTGYDSGLSIQQTLDKGYIITGETASFGAGSFDIFVVKLDSSGNLLWAKTIGGPEKDESYSIQQTSDGGYIIVGDTESFGAGYYDIFVVKLDSSGNLLWAKTIGGQKDDSGYSIQQTLDKGYIITGYTESFGAGFSDIFVVKLDSSGNLLWAKTIGGKGYDYGNSIQQTLDRGYIITGETSNSGSKYFLDIFVVKLDSSGNLLWAKTIGEISYDDYSNSVYETLDGGYIIAGHTFGFGAGNFDVFIIKLDASGSFSWAKTIGGPEKDESYSIQQTLDGGYIIVGETESFGVGESDIFVVKLDSSGNLLWAKTIGGPEKDESYSIQQTSDGGYIIVGDTSSIKKRNYDIFVIKLDSSGNVPECNLITSQTPSVSSQSPINVSQTPSISSQNPTVSSPVPIVSFQNPNTQSQCLTTNFTPLFLTPQGNLAIRTTSNQYKLEKNKDK